MNHSDITIGAVGGDLRQEYAKKALSRLGYRMASYGDDPLEGDIPAADVLLLPLPVLQDGMLYAPFGKRKIAEGEMLRLISGNVRLLCGGNLPESVTGLAKERGIPAIDLWRKETFQLRNALPTAEGALSLAMEHLPRTVWESHTAVVGYGRIGKLLCRLLSAVGSHVTLVSRNPVSRAEAALAGCRPMDFEAYSHAVGETDVLFNTVPAHVIGEEILSGAREDMLFIELASSPGGIDPAAALAHKTHVITAKGLPGRYSPETAGEIVASCVNEVIEEVLA